MTKPGYQTTIRLTAEQQILMDSLRENKISIMDVFRKGLAFYLVDVPKEVIEKAKALV